MLGKPSSLVLVVALFACAHPAASDEVVEAPEPSKPEPSEPEPDEPEPSEPEPAEPAVDRPYAESRKTLGSENAAHYQFEGDAFTTDLELDAKLTKGRTMIQLGHAGSKPVEVAGPDLCASTFDAGDSLNAQILDHGPLADGRRLLEIWVSCRSGEDIVAVESVVLLAIDDGKALSSLWWGMADYHGSWVCATFDELEFAVEGNEVVLTRKAIGEVYEPGNEGYDCADARVFSESRGVERIALP